MKTVTINDKKIGIMEIEDHFQDGVKYYFQEKNICIKRMGFDKGNYLGLLCGNVKERLKENPSTSFYWCFI